MMFLSKWIDDRGRSKASTMSEADAAAQQEYDIEVTLNKGLATGYAHWLQPIVGSGHDFPATEADTASPANPEDSGSDQTAVPPRNTTPRAAASRLNGRQSTQSSSSDTRNRSCGSERAKQLGYWDYATGDDNHHDAMELDEEAASSSADPAPAPQRRGRGRPRVNKVRDESAIEKRRAQVRNAQRTYQKKKDQVSSNTNQRCDELLEVLSDLSADIEELLQSAAKSGLMGQKDEIATKVQRLWDSYDVAINKPIVAPELRLLRIKNYRRQAEYKSMEGFRIRSAEGEPRSNTIAPVRAPPCPNNQPEVDLELVRHNGTTMIQPFDYNVTHYKSLAGKNIFDLVRERQARYSESADEDVFPGPRNASGTRETRNS